LSGSGCSAFDNSSQLLDAHRQLIGAGAKQHALGAEEITDVVPFELLIGGAQRASCRNSCIWPLRSAILAKLALPMTRLFIMRPPTRTRTALLSSHAASRCP
jgi:hypothetical protein